MRFQNDIGIFSIIKLDMKQKIIGCMVTWGVFVGNNAFGRAKVDSVIGHLLIQK